MLGAVFFDLDDTLYLERDYVHSGFRAVAEFVETKGIDSSTDCLESLWNLFKAGVRSDTFNRWARSKQADALVPELVRVYRQHEPRIDLQPGAVELLSWARSVAPTGVVTDGAIAGQQRKVDALRLNHLVDTVVYSDAWGRAAWKPSPIPYLKALEACGASAEQSVYVADNPTKDFIGARAVGMRTLRLRHADGLHASVEPASADYAADLEVTTVAQVQQAIEALGSARPERL